MKKRICSIILIIIMMLNVSGISIAENDVKGKMYFRYIDVETGEELDADEPLFYGKYYDLEVRLSDFEVLSAFQIPIHFNNGVMKIVSFEDNSLINDGVSIKKEAAKGLRGLKYNSGTLKNAWIGGECVCNDVYPYTSNAEGVIKTQFMNNSACDIADESTIFSIRFYAASTGNTDIRIADENDKYYDAASKEGATFMQLFAGDIKPTDISSDIEIFAPAKKVVYLPTGVSVTPEKKTVYIGDSFTLSTKVMPTGADERVEWSVDNEGIAEVDSMGNVTALAEGEAIVTAKTMRAAFADTCIVTIIDRRTPNAPKNLKLVSMTGSSASFSWEAVESQYAVSSYKIFCDGEEIAEVSADEKLEYTDSSLEAGTTYSYTVAACYYDEADDKTFVSAQSKALKVIPAAPKVVSVIPASGKTMGINYSEKFAVYYEDTKNSDGASVKLEYSIDNGNTFTELNIDAEAGKEAGLNTFEFSVDLSELESGEYIFRYTVIDKDGHSGSVDATYEIDSEAPSKLKNFEVTAEGGDRCLYLSWDRAIEADVCGYKIYRSESADSEFELYRSITGRNVLFYEDDNVVVGKEYFYYVTAIDGFNQESEPSEIKSGIPTEDDTCPRVLTLLPSTNIISGITEISAVVEDNIGVERVMLQYSTDDKETWIDVEEKAPTGNSVKFDFDTRNFESGSKISVRVIAYDAMNNASNGDHFRDYVIDNEGPEQVKNLHVIEATGSTITLQWDDVYDEDRAYFIVEMKDNETGEFRQYGDKITNRNWIKVENLELDTEYTFIVTAYDNCDNKGIPSEECTGKTDTDRTKPIITDISPKAKKINENLTVTFTATDDMGVAEIAVQVSENNGEDWKDVAVLEPASPADKVVLKHNLDISGYGDGIIIVRAIPKDIYGNIGNEKGVQYYVDKTAPKAPTGLYTVEKEGYVDITWKQATDTDVAYYIVYRSESENGEFAVIRDYLEKINCKDTNVEQDKTYYYKVKAVDDVGNVSEASNVVSGKMLPDLTAPEVKLSPAKNSYIKNGSAVTVYSYDKNVLKNVVLEYRLPSSGIWNKLGESASEIAKFTLDSSTFKRDGEYVFRATATDASGNVGKSDEYTYIMDNTAPVIYNEKAVPGIKSIYVTWNSDDKDLYKLSVYYAKAGGSYRIASDRAPSENGSYNCAIQSLDASYQYYIKIVATDKAENETIRVIGPVKPEWDTENDPEAPGFVDVTPPVVNMNVPSTLVVNEEEYFDASKSSDNVAIKSYLWDFGDGTTSTQKKPRHYYSETGNYNVTLTVTDTSGNSGIGKKTITVVEPSEKASLKVTVLDDAGNIIPDASVVFDCAGEKSTEYFTNHNGVADITAAPGKYVVGIYKDGYLPTEIEVSLTRNSVKKETVSIVKQNIVVGSLTWKKMSLQDIIDAGINLEDKGNYDWYEYKVKLIIGGEEVVIEGYKPDDDQPIRVDNVVSKDYTHDTPTNNKGQIVQNTVWVYDFNDKVDGYEYTKDETSEKPKTLIAYVEVPGEASWLKEFFDVKLTVSNEADEKFVIEDCTAELLYPTEGLTLMTDLSSTYSPTALTEMGDIAGQHEQSVHWCLRGDKTGEYDISALFNGILKLGTVEKEINAEFRSETPVKVYGADGMSYVVEFENAATATDDYMFRVGLKNGGKIDRYYPKMRLDVSDEDKVALFDYKYTTENEEEEKEYSYFEYVELNSGVRMENQDTLRPAEIMFSNYIIKGLDENTDFEKIIVERIGGTVNLPVEFRPRKPLAFHERKMEFYCENSEGGFVQVSSLQMYRGDTMKLAVKVSDKYPGLNEYIPVEGVQIYSKTDNGKYEQIGTTDADGMYRFEYTVPKDFDEASKYDKDAHILLSVKGNRTQERNVNIQVLKESKANLIGVVQDEFGNPIKEAAVTLEDSDEIFETDKTGAFEILGRVPGKIRITINKSGYYAVSEEHILPAGDTKLIFRLKLVPKKVKPKIANVKSEIFRGNSEVIIPEGMFFEDTLEIIANISSGSIAKYVMKRAYTDGNGQETEEVLAETEENTYTFNLSDLKAGDRVYVVAVSDLGVESKVYELPVAVKKAPFVNLLNNRNADVQNNKVSVNLSFADLFRNYTAKSNESVYWLDGEAKKVWVDLFDRFKLQMSLNVSSMDKDLQSNTDFYIDWFAYKNFRVTAEYNMRTGLLSIKPYVISTSSYVPDWLHMIYGGGNGFSSNMLPMGQAAGKINTGYFTFEETIDENIRKASGYKYEWLEAWNRYSWDLESNFSVNFMLNDDEWEGYFNLRVDDEHDFYGTYVRKMRSFENIVTPFLPEYLVGQWNKHMYARENTQIPLTEEGLNNSEFSMNYNTATQGAWLSGLGRITLSSYSNNKISFLPEARIQGTTTLRGTYYVLGFRRFIYGSDYVNKWYDSKYDMMQASLMSVADEVSNNPDAEFEPIKLASVETTLDENTIDSQVFENADVKVVDSESPMMFYLKYGDNKAQYDASTLVLSKYNAEEKKWSAPNVVSNDGTGDYMPSVASNGRNVAVVWAEAENPVTNISSEEEVWNVENIRNNVASKLGISVAVYDNNGDFVEKLRIPVDAEGVNYAPVAVYSGEKLAVAWITNAEGDMVSESRNDQIMYSIYENGVWSKPGFAVSGTGTYSELSLAEENGRIYLLYAEEAMETFHYDNNNANVETISEASDEEVKSDHMTKRYKVVTRSKDAWSLPDAINRKSGIDTACSFVKEDGGLKYMLTSNSTLYTIDAKTREYEKEVEIEELRELTEMAVITDNSSNPLIIWAASSDNGQHIFTVTQNAEGEWNAPVELASATTDSIIKNLSPVTGNDGMQIVYNKFNYSDGELENVELCVAREPELDLECTGFEMTSGTAMSGATLEFNASLKNNSLTDVESYELVLSEEKLGEISRIAVEEAIAPGAEVTHKLQWKCDEVTDNMKVKLEIVSAGDTNPDNNNAEYDVIVKNIAIAEVTTSASDGIAKINVLLHNSGTVASDATVVKITDMNKNELASSAVNSIESGAGLTVTFDIKESVLPEKILVEAVVVSTEIDEIDNIYEFKVPENNGRYLTGKINIDPFVLDRVKIKLSNDDASIERGLDENATFIINGEKDKYEFVVSGDGILPRKISSLDLMQSGEVKGEGTADSDGIELILGDVYPDETESINYRDIASVIGYVNKKEGELDTLGQICNIIPSSEENATEGVDVDDLSVVVNNFGKNSKDYAKMEVVPEG